MSLPEGTGEAAVSTANVANPVLPGCHPDPSVCRVGADFYLVTSTFEYFPGIPVFHSRDLVHWRPVGHVLDRPSQVDLGTVASSEGIFAATIRHHRGRFYVVTTLVGGSGRGGTFVVSATDPAGPWSDPVWLDDAPGIDPSLFFDDDGRAWCTGTRLAEPGEWEGQTDVWLREFDTAALTLTGPEHLLWRGALHGAVWAEGPHLYKVDGRYYLLAAEGGTEHGHAVSVARADHVTGPYTGNPANPVFTHRHLGRDFPVVGVGHADLVRTAEGQWWAVLLGSRPYGGYHPNLGRETFLVPVRWEDGWPLFAPGAGTTLGPFRPPAVARPSGGPHPDPVRDDFDGPRLDPRWNQVRTAEPFWSLTARPGALRLPLGPATLAEVGTPASSAGVSSTSTSACPRSWTWSPGRRGSGRESPSASPRRTIWCSRWPATAEAAAVCSPRSAPAARNAWSRRRRCPPAPWCCGSTPRASATGCATPQPARERTRRPN